MISERGEFVIDDRGAAGMRGACGAWDWDIVADRLYVDKGFSELLGLDPSAGRGGVDTKLFFSRIHRDDRARMKIAVAGMLGGAELFFKEFRVQRPDGAVRWMHGRGHSLLDAEDRPVRFTGLLEDITERRRAEERLRIAQTAGGVGTFEHQSGFATVSVSPQFCTVLGLHPTEVLPVTTVNNAIYPSGPPLIPERHGAELTAAADFRIRRSSDGEIRWVARRGEVVADDGGDGVRFIGVIYDITAAKNDEARLRELNENLENLVDQAIRDRSEVEEALRQAQKMEAVGQLTGGIAHDFNNLLQGITGSLELLQMRISQGRTQELDRFITGAMTAANRAAALTHRLLAFSRRQPLAPRPVRVNQLIRSMEDLLRRTLSERIELTLVLAADLAMTLCDPNQLENAILNLVINARDAMPEGGRLTIETSNAQLGDARAARQRDVAPGAYVCVAVSDTGVGMDSGTISKAFEPFFTTKPMGQGTGLGLSMIYGFVRQSEGGVEIASEVGKGTLIKLYLPDLLGEEAAPPPAVSQPGAVRPSEAGETVLVVEDESVVRNLIVEVLGDLGYRAIEASDGPAGLAVLQSKRKVDLLITDIGLPGLNGRQIADAGRGLHPDMKILFMTGYAENAAIASGFLEHGMTMITKPFTMEVLAARVREIIEQR
jgi:PAS domain S-box-containing protein